MAVRNTMLDMVEVLRSIRAERLETPEAVAEARRRATETRADSRKIKERTVYANCIRDRKITWQQFDDAVLQWVNNGTFPLRYAIESSYGPDNLWTVPECQALFTESTGGNREVSGFKGSPVQ